MNDGRDVRGWSLAWYSELQPGDRVRVAKPFADEPEILGEVHGFRDVDRLIVIGDDGRSADIGPVQDYLIHVPEGDPAA